MSNRIQTIIAAITALIAIVIALWYHPVSSKLPDFSSLLLGTAGALIGSVIAWLITRRLAHSERKILFLFPDDEENIAKQIVQDLLKHKIRVILESELIKPGDNIQKTVKAVMNDIDTVLVINSRGQEEKRIQKLILSIAKLYKKRIIPVTTTKSKSADSNIKGSDFSSEYDESFESLYESLAS
jgi:hypothetical protein